MMVHGMMNLITNRTKIIEMNDERTYQALVDKERIPRKHKLAWLGRRLSKKQIREKIERWRSRPEDEQNHSYFCPNCGCGSGYLHDHEVEYPEIWKDEYCLRCHTKIAWTDNSPWRFALNNLFKKD